MPQIRKIKVLPYTSTQMFDLVADVEKYPQFLPWCSNARLIKRSENELIGTIVMQKGTFSKSFTTRNTFEYPKFMDISLLEGTFTQLNARWEFNSLKEGCEVRYDMNFEVPFFLAPILGGLLKHIGNTMVDAFSARAKAIYG